MRVPLMTPLSMRRTTIAAAMSAVALASITACATTGHGSPRASVSPASPDGMAAAAATYIARHPAPPVPGMDSGILISSEYAGAVPCDTGQRCWRWSGTVIEAGGRAVQIGTVTAAYDCSGPLPMSSVGPDPLLDAYIYFPADSSRLCPPDDVIVIRRSAVGPAGNSSGWTAA